MTQHKSRVELALELAGYLPLNCSPEHAEAVGVVANKIDGSDQRAVSIALANVLLRLVALDEQAAAQPVRKFCVFCADPAGDDELCERHREICARSKREDAQESPAQAELREARLLLGRVGVVSFEAAAQTIARTREAILPLIPKEWDDDIGLTFATVIKHVAKERDEAQAEIARVNEELAVWQNGAPGLEDERNELLAELTRIKTERSGHLERLVAGDPEAMRQQSIDELEAIMSRAYERCERERDEAQAELAQVKELLQDWELLGATITGCTNHSGRIALEDAKAQMDTHTKVMHGLINTQRERGEKAEAELTRIKEENARLSGHIVELKKATRDWGDLFDKKKAELRKRDAVVEAAREALNWIDIDYPGGHDARANLHTALSALDQPAPVFVTRESDPYFTGPAYGAVVIGEPATDGEVLPLSGPATPPESPDSSGATYAAWRDCPAISWDLCTCPKGKPSSPTPPGSAIVVGHGPHCGYIAARCDRDKVLIDAHKAAGGKFDWAGNPEPPAERPVLGSEETEPVVGSKP